MRALTETLTRARLGPSITAGSLLVVFTACAGGALAEGTTAETTTVEPPPAEPGAATSAATFGGDDPPDGSEVPGAIAVDIRDDLSQNAIALWPPNLA